MTGVAVKVDPVYLNELFQTAKAAPGVYQVELRRGVTRASKPIEDAIKTNAGFSTRIPGAVKTKASFSRGSASVVIRVDASKAPHAAPINHGGSGGNFRHPVYGTDVWVEQSAHPFFDNGIRQGEPASEQAMGEVMDAIGRALGFH